MAESAHLLVCLSGGEGGSDKRFLWCGKLRSANEQYSGKMSSRAGGSSTKC